MNIIYDCDNTMGIKNRDIDDGLALLYLLGCKEVDLKAITTTFGNDTLETVYAQTKELVEELGIQTPLYKGGAEQIVEIVNENQGKISILATGSLQNIYEAYEIDKTIVDKINSIVIMGGITEDLYFNGKKMNELNFSVSSKAAYTVLKKFKNISVLSGNNCMEVEFSKKELDKIQAKKNAFVLDKIESWLRDFKEKYNYDAVVLWDVIAAIYLVHPELFEEGFFGFESTQEDMKTGFLRLSEGKREINIPKIKSCDKINIEMVEKVWK